MIVVFAIVGALLLIATIVFVSMRLTERKSTEKLKKRLPDATSVNAGSVYPTTLGGD